MAEIQPETKKRKRTGKQREEAKRAAIAAKLEAEAAAKEEAVVPAVQEDAAEEVQPDVIAEGSKPDDAPVAVAEDAVDYDKIAKRIPMALKKLHPVFKQAKKSETMRLIKKMRFLKTKPEKASEVADLEAQLKLLSVVQLHTLSATHLHQKLKKHHLLKHRSLPESITSLAPNTPSVPASSSSATPSVIAKAENRLCSAKFVADAIKPAVAWVLSEPGATLVVSRKEAAKPKAKRGRRGGADSDDDGSMADESGGEDEGPVLALDSDDEAVIEDKAADAAGWESGSVGGDGDDGDGDGWESSSVDGGGYNIAPPSSGPESDGDDKNDSDSSASAPAPPAKRAKPAPPSPPARGKKAQGTSSSMFLPSLAAGFAAGSDSDPDNDYDPDGIIGSKKGERKNRRGQRARQAIWEKKYGKGAKHVIKAREEAVRGPQGQKRDSGWGARAGATGAAGAPAAAAAPSTGPPAGRPAGRPRDAPAPAPQGKDAGKALHPSWEAARLRRQKEMGGAPNDAPKATKIVFD